ncbi:MAG: BlaI/MecI/CopY family transcriptional regulator [Cyclobacteriaceae bacterium]|nr:BlaI/MecI/CopY family transcriptional regulator [Cyclobacteriaceae bacterium]
MSLTKSEEQIMKHLWKLERAFMKDLVEEFPDPKPAYTTIATILTRMIEKKYVGFVQQGKVREYYPILNRTEYFKNHVNAIISVFFNDSVSQFASFFTSNADLTIEQLQELRTLIDAEINQKET